MSIFKKETTGIMGEDLTAFVLVSETDLFVFYLFKVH